MMLITIIIGVLLLVIVIAIMLRAASSPSPNLSNSRDTINKAYYHDRLREIEQDQQQGVVLDPAPLVQELQQNLLQDIPLPTANQSSLAEKQQTKIVMIICCLLLLSITLTTYWFTGSFRQVSHWQQVKQSFSQLNQKANNNTLANTEIADYALGLRSWLAENPTNVDGWLTLGTLAVNSDDLSVAMPAFQQAFLLAPENPEVLTSYGRILLFSTDPQQAQLGIRLLNQAVEKGSVEAIKILAFSALEAQDLPLALIYWQRWLKQVPADEPSRGLIEKTVETIRQQLEQDK